MTNDIHLLFFFFRGGGILADPAIKVLCMIDVLEITSWSYLNKTLKPILKGIIKYWCSGRDERGGSYKQTAVMLSSGRFGSQQCKRHQLQAEPSMSSMRWTVECWGPGGAGRGRLHREASLACMVKVVSVLPGREWEKDIPGLGNTRRSENREACLGDSD